MAEWLFEPIGQPQVPSGNEPMLMRSGETVNITPPVVTDATTRQWAFEPVQQDYANREPGFLEKNLPPALQPYAGRVADIATGANDSLAGALAIPANSVANIFQGLAGKQFTDVGEMKTAIQDTLRNIPGMGASKEQAFNEWYANLGEQAGRQALLTMALIAGAPALIAGGQAAGGTAGAVMKNIGETAISHPGMVAAADAGAVIGGEVLPQTAPYLEAAGLNADPDFLSLIGTLAGGPLGASMATLARIRPTGVKEGLFGPKETFGGMPRFGGSLVKQSIPGARPLLGQSFNGDDVARAVKGTQEQVTAWMQNRIKQVTKGGTIDPGVAAQRVREVTNQAYDKARHISETEYWSKVDTSRPVPVKDIQATAQEIALSAQDPSVKIRDIPGDYINDIMKWSGTKKKPATEQSMQRLRQMASVMRKEASTLGMAGSAFPSDVRRANLTKLANAIDDSIAAAYPDDLDLAKAKQFTTWMHDTFSRGPVGQFGEVRRVPGATTDAPGAIKAAMRDSRFPEQLAEMGQRTGLGAEVQGRSEDYLRGMVDEAYRTAGPRYGMDPLREELYKTTAAREYMESPEFKRFAKAFPQMDAVFQRQTTQLQNATGKAVEIARSKFFNLAATDPENAVDNLFGSGTKVRDSQMIMENIGSSPEAVDAIQYALIRKLGNSTNWDPESMVARLGAKDLEKTFTTIMGPKEYAHFKRILDTGASLQTGEAGNLIGMSPTRTVGRVLGTLFTGAAGGKSIQVHSIGTKIGGNVMERIFHVVPPEMFIQKAMTDPNWERFLMSKLPENMEGFKTTTRLVGLLAGGVEAAHRKAIEEIGTSE